MHQTKNDYLIESIDTYKTSIIPILLSKLDNFFKPMIEHLDELDEKDEMTSSSFFFVKHLKYGKMRVYQVCFKFNKDKTFSLYNMESNQNITNLKYSRIIGDVFNIHSQFMNYLSQLLILKNFIKISKNKN